jgi:hypothetical protein
MASEKIPETTQSNRFAGGERLAAGHAELRGDKIATIVLVRSTLDPAKGPIDPQCWTS